jgi:hypothetical protein
MRLVAGVAVIVNEFASLTAGPRIEQAIVEILAIIAGLLLAAGLWTPVTGSLVALVGVSNALSRGSDMWAGILLAAIGGALALVGPGAWSVDARLFGWKRIDIRDRKG